MNQTVRFTEVRIKALQLVGTTPGVLEQQIAESIEKCNPIRTDVLREALALELGAYGTPRFPVLCHLRREIKRQESLQKEAA
jgi:hypothetical protein